MLTLIEANWQAFVAVLVLGLLVAWALWGRKGPRERHRAPDALDEGAGPARRNQALIDAPPAATLSATLAAGLAAGLADTGPGGVMAGICELIAAGAAHEARAVEATGEMTEATAIAPAAPEVPGDDLTRIKGLGPKLKARLAELGVTSFAQIAAWSNADIEAIDAQLGSFAGRATRDQWVAQAGFLSIGDVAGYEAKFGKL